jgi:DUF1009 family protein
MRFDVPCVGPDTIRDLAAAGGKCLVIEAGKTIIIDKPQTLAIADEMGVCVVGTHDLPAPLNKPSDPAGDGVR